MSVDLTLVVMAAGASRRYGRLKQTTPVGPTDQTLLEYGLYDTSSTPPISEWTSNPHPRPGSGSLIRATNNLWRPPSIT